MRARIVLWVAVGAYLSIIFALSAQPNPLPALTAVVWDKLLHAAEYGGLGLLLNAALRASGLPARRAFVLALAGASLYGASDELHQLFVPGRDSEVLDWVADTVGGGIGAAATTLIATLRDR